MGPHDRVINYQQLLQRCIQRHSFGDRYALPFAALLLLFPFIWAQSTNVRWLCGDALLCKFAAVSFNAAVERSISRCRANILFSHRFAEHSNSRLSFSCKQANRLQLNWVVSLEHTQVHLLDRIQNFEYNFLCFLFTCSNSFRPYYENLSQHASLKPPNYTCTNKSSAIRFICISFAFFLTLVALFSCCRMETN